MKLTFGVEKLDNKPKHDVISNAGVRRENQVNLTTVSVSDRNQRRPLRNKVMKKWTSGQWNSQGKGAETVSCLASYRSVGRAWSCVRTETGKSRKIKREPGASRTI